MIPTRVILASICASYIHTPLALYALKAYAGAYAQDIAIETFTANHTDDFILRRLYEVKPDIIGFSCAVWNIEKTLRAAADLRKLLPSVTIIFGGPEMAADYESYLDIADIVVPGEGEIPFLALLDVWSNAPGIKYADLSSISGIAWRGGNRIRYNPPDSLPGLSALPFPYADGLAAFTHKIIYYEASRGCPFRCAYCLSAGMEDRGDKVHKNTRLRPLDDTFRDLKIFLDAGVKQVKFTDRTFNANADFACAIWRFLIDNDNGVTNFHFEIAADLLGGPSLSLLSRARRGLFQFEVGVQSSNEEALSAVERITHLPKLFENVRRVKSFGNIHLHLDLIAGLPGEDYTSFKRSFNETYSLRPDQLQLGFLKLLKGTPLQTRAGDLGIVYKTHPPYEVLSTRELSHTDILRLKAAEDMTEIYHNSGWFTHSLLYLTSHVFNAPFELFERLGDFWYGGGYHKENQSKQRRYELLLTFIQATVHENAAAVVKDLLRFDLLVNENEKSLPSMLDAPLSPEEKRRARAYRAGGAPARRVERFNIDILSWLADMRKPPYSRLCYIQFDYPGLGRQSPFTLIQRIKEITL